MFAEDYYRSEVLFWAVWSFENKILIYYISQTNMGFLKVHPIVWPSWHNLTSVSSLSGLFIAHANTQAPAHY